LFNPHLSKKLRRSNLNVGFFPGKEFDSHGARLLALSSNFMADNIPGAPSGAVPPKKETGKVQPKKETVRINLPPKPTAAPTIKLPTLPPGGPAASAAAAPAPALSTTAPAAPAAPRPAAAAAPAAISRSAAPAPMTPRAAAPTTIVQQTSTLDTVLAIVAAVAALVAVGTTIYVMQLF
jgi:hypothetical protein